MENSRNRHMGVNKIGKMIKKNPLHQQTIDFGNNVSGRNSYPQPKVHHIHRDDFKSFVINVTGKESNVPRNESGISRLQQNRPPPLADVRPHVGFPMQPPPPRAQQYVNGPPLPPLQPISGPPVFDNSWNNNFVESPISAYMRKFQESVNIGATSSNQFQPYPPQQQMINNVNVNVQFQPQYFPIQTQVVNNVEHYNPSSSINQTFTNGNPSVSLNAASNQTFPMNAASNQTFPMNVASTQTFPMNVASNQAFPMNAASNQAFPMNAASNQAFPMNASNQFLNGFPPSQANYSQPPTSEFLLASPTQNANMLSPQSPYRPLLSPSIFSSPSSPEYPFEPYLYNEILSCVPPSPLSASMFPFTSPNRLDDQ